MALLLDHVQESCSGAVALPVARVDLWKRRWRGVAADGTEVAVALAEAARDGQCLAGGGRCFLIKQREEELVVIPLPPEVDMAAKIGWYLGNRHIPIEVRGSMMLMENFPTLTDSLTRIGIRYHLKVDVLACRPHSADHRH